MTEDNKEGGTDLMGPLTVEEAESLGLTNQSRSNTGRENEGQER